MGCQKFQKPPPRLILLYIYISPGLVSNLGFSIKPGAMFVGRWRVYRMVNTKTDKELSNSHID